MICLCEICVGSLPNLSKGVVCGAVYEYVISFAISESFILVSIGRYWDGTWVKRVLCCPRLMMSGLAVMFLVLYYN